MSDPAPRRTQGDRACADERVELVLELVFDVVVGWPAARLGEQARDVVGAAELRTFLTPN
jgi:hypothetical protein